MINEEITEIPEGITVVATGPLTSHPLAESIKAFNGSDGFYFYDEGTNRRQSYDRYG